MHESAMGLGDRPSRRPGLVAVSVDDELIVVDEEHARLHHLDALAAAVWELLDGGTPLEQVCTTLAQRFAADPSRVQADVVALTERLVSEGLILPGPRC